jgi:hypothetical protein
LGSRFPNSLAELFLHLEVTLLQFQHHPQLQLWAAFTLPSVLYWPHSQWDSSNCVMYILGATDTSPDPLLLLQNHFCHTEHLFLWGSRQSLLHMLSSHMVVLLFYGTTFFKYLSSTSGSVLKQVWLHPCLTLHL